MKGFVTALLVLTIFWTPSGECQRSPRPHIIFILADDLGWNDVELHGETEIPTPNINALASDGILLNQYYILPLCTPSRASLMTGFYAANVGLQNSVINFAAPYGLPLNFTTMPEHLQELGYTTRMVGKWHLGFFESRYTPIFRGFDSHYGLWGPGSDQFHHTGMVIQQGRTFQGAPKNLANETILFNGLDFRDDMEPVRNQQERYLADIYTEKSVEIIRKHDPKKPLFLYLAHHAVHRGNWFLPVTSPPEYAEGFQFISNLTRQQFAGAVTALDVSIGRVVQALYANGMLDNSIIAFSSDNGADFAAFTANAGSNWPLRGQKFTNWEGGVRGVGFLWSPLLRRNRRISDQMMHISDWLPTLYSAAGGDVSTLPKMDGVDMWEALSEDLPSPRNLTLINVDQIWNMGALRLGDFKLLSGTYRFLDLDNWFGPSAREAIAPPEFRRESKVAEVLRAMYDDESLRFETPVVSIECGLRSSDPTAVCEPFLAPCLFNIRLDPCEYNNIASQNPRLVREMVDLLQEFNRTSYPPANKMPLYSASPMNYGGLWVPFGDDVDDYY